MVGDYMKILLLTLPLLLIAVGCDSPQRTRLGSTVNTGNGLTAPDNSTNPWGTGGSTGNGGGTTGSSGSGSVKPAGFENCDISAKYYAAGVNYMGICQSTLDETSVAVNSTVSDSARTCLIPTYKDNSGSSTYLGQPQCFAPQAGVVTMGKLYKTRAGFTNNPITGVMVMKEISLTAYFTCMNAYVNFRNPQCPYGAKTNAYCDSMAKAQMATICNNFKADHAYIDICVKSSYCGN